MRALQRHLSSIFRAADHAKALNEVQLAEARAMRKAMALAREHGIELERDRDGRWVTLPTLADTDDDPLEGSHFCVGGHETLQAVEAYVAFINTRTGSTK